MFLRHPRIYQVISANLLVHYSIIRPFWETSRYVAGENHIVAEIQGKKIIVDVYIIRKVLGFGDNDDYVYYFDRELIKGLFQRLEYNGDLNKSQYNKTHLCEQYKYLLHVLIHCLDGRRGGFDECRIMLQSTFASLVLNKPFNFSEMVFYHLKGNCTTSTHKFVMYPHFLRMIINHLEPNLI